MATSAAPTPVTTTPTPTAAPPTTPLPFWQPNVWTAISTGVTNTVGAVRVSQKVIPGPAIALTGVTSVPAPTFDPKKMSLTEGVTQPYVELAVEFPLTNGQVNSDSSGTAAITLSSFAARDLALAEDLMILQGKDGTFPESVRIESGAETLKGGIVGLVPHHNIVKVPPPDHTVPTNSGAGIWAAIQKAIGLLTKGSQSGPWAVIADTAAFAEIAGSVLNGNPVYSLLTANSMFAPGIWGTPGMPPNTALVIATGGQPSTIYVDTDATMEPTHKGASGHYLFRVFERVQIVALDPRAFVKLDFSYLHGTHEK